MPRRRLHPSARALVAGLLTAWLGVLAVALLAPSPAGPAWLVETVSRIGTEQGLPAYEASFWFAVIAPAGTPGPEAVPARRRKFGV